MTECEEFGHLMTITYSRPWRAFFRRRYYVRCWECDWHRGPFRAEKEARVAMGARKMTDLGRIVNGPWR